MPLYDYNCPDCDNSFETIRKVDERETCDCPECGAIASQVISGARFKLDGTDPSWGAEYDRWGKRRMKEMKRLKKLRGE